MNIGLFLLIVDGISVALVWAEYIDIGERIANHIKQRYKMSKRKR